MLKPWKILSSVIFCLVFSGCTDRNKASDKKEVWIYTSLYKDTIGDLKPQLEKAFPQIEFNFYQAGSEEIAAKVNAELLAGQTKADVLISSDRFWYEDLSNQNRLHKFKAPNSETVPTSLVQPDGFYTALSIPVMVLSYNKEAIKKENAPKNFKDLTDAKWKGKISTGSPLASGTNFTTVAMLVHHYGWDFVKGLRKNETIAQGGNSAVIRRLQSKERPVGWVLLENLLRFKGKDERLEIVYPEDGTVVQANVIAITKKEGSRKEAEEFVNWMFGKEGQEAMVKSYMYATVKGIKAPEGAPPFEKIMANSFPWTKEFIEKVVKDRGQIKEQFSKIMFE